MFHVVPAVGLSENDAVVKLGLLLAGSAALARGAGSNSCDSARRSRQRAGEARAAMMSVNFAIGRCFLIDGCGVSLFLARPRLFIDLSKSLLYSSSSGTVLTKQLTALVRHFGAEG